MAKSTTTKVFGYTDIHWSDRDEKALTVARLAQAYMMPDITVIGGDLLNADPFTRFSRSKVPKGLVTDWGEDELKPSLKFLDNVQALTKQHTYFVEGNHDAWIERWAANNSTAATTYSLISPRLHIVGNRSRFSYLPYVPEGQGRNSALVLHPKLAVVHGWSICRHAAAKHLELSRSRSVIFHHTHRIQRDVGRDPWTGQPIEAFSAGCLCKLQPKYAHGGSPTQWNHGFWVAYLGKRNYTAYAIEIHKGSCVLPDGKEIKL